MKHQLWLLALKSFLTISPLLVIILYHLAYPRTVRQRHWAEISHRLWG